ncbi:unnamed protein product, partial [Rotaria sp. Silwood2]
RFYTLLIENIQQNTIVQPSEFQYNQLQQMYSSNLYCSCSSISMNYSTFITIQPSFHQVCSSGIVSDQLINYNFDNAFNPSIIYNINDYRFSGKYPFELLSIFCEQAQHTVNISLETFLQAQFASSQVISPDFFEFKIHSSIRN